MVPPHRLPALSGTIGATYTLDFYANPAGTANPSGYGQGQRYLGSAVVTITGVSGSTNFSVTLGASTNAGKIVTATATDSSGDTSEFSADVTAAPNLVVTNTQDGGSGSLRAAIMALDVFGTPNTIQFRINSGNLTIAPTSALPTITQPVTIDGTTQPGYSGTPLIILDGVNAGSAFGLVTTAGGNTIRGLVIYRFQDGGIALIDPGDDLIQGNYIGTNGSSALGSAISGAFGIAALAGGSNNTIGGTTAGARNVISGYDLGLDVGSGSLVEGNYIGTDSTGTRPLGLGTGIEIGGSTTVGGSTTAPETSSRGTPSTGSLSTVLTIWLRATSSALRPMDLPPWAMAIPEFTSTVSNRTRSAGRRRAPETPLPSTTPRRQPAMGASWSSVRRPSAT